MTGHLIVLMSVVTCISIVYAIPFNISTQKTSLKEALFAKIKFQNGYDGRLNVNCHESSGMYKINSEYSRGARDRVWRWECRNIGYGYPHCWKTSYVNDFDKPMFFMCGKNQYIAGVDSYHSNAHEDRRWRFTCCYLPFYSTKSCRLTDFVNKFRHSFHFLAGHNEVITGVSSYDANNYQ